MRGKRAYSEAQVDRLLSLAYRCNHMRDTWARVKDCNIYTKSYKKTIERLLNEDRKAFEDYLHNPKQPDI